MFVRVGPASRRGSLGARCLERAAIALVVFALVGPAPAVANDHVPPMRVVMLYGSDYLLPAVVTHNQALRRTLESDPKLRFDLYSDAIDAQRLDAAAQEPAFLELLRTKYAGMRVDLVVAGNSFAHDFAQRHRQQLWPQARLLLHNSPEAPLRSRTLAPGDVAMPIRFDIEGTIELARRLQPDARRIVIVGGVGDRDRAWRRAVAEAATRRAPDLERTELGDGSLVQMLEALRALPKDSIVYYTTLFRDAAGHGYVPRDVAPEIAAASPVPVYSHVGSYLGQGVLGGALTDDDADGRRVGQMILAMLGPTARPAGGWVEPAPGTCVVDWRAATRLNVSLTTLPPECRIANRPLSIWETYRAQAIAAVAVIAVQVLLIGALFLQLQRRRRAEREVARRLGELAQATRLATLGELTAAISHEINQPLGAILSNADAAEMLLGTDEPRLDEVRQILADIRRDDLRASRVVSGIRALLAKGPRQTQRFMLDGLIEETLAFVRSEAKRSGIAVELSGPPVAVEGDRVQLQQVLLNLLINAMDAVRDLPSERRRIAVRTGVTPTGRIELAVADSGPGIPSERVDRIFDSFFTSKAAGLGLGLSLARTIVEAHRGTIRVESPAAGGASFVVALPGAAAPIAEVGPAPRDDAGITLPTPGGP
jgi:signal transduction histidine kinase